MPLDDHFFANTANSEMSLHLPYIGQLMEESSIVPISEIFEIVKSLQIVRENVVHWLLVAYPLMFLRTVNRKDHIINLHQTALACDEIDNFLQKKDVANHDVESSKHAKTNEEKIKIKTKGTKAGPTSIVEKVPNNSWCCNRTY